MKRLTATLSLTLLLIQAVASQTPQKPQPEVVPEDVIRITTNLVQTDVVVTDKNDRVIPDLKLEDFELYDNGKKQEVKFLEYVGVDEGVRSEGNRPPSLGKNVVSVTQTGTDVSAGQIRRVIGFVIDDLTIPIQDFSAVRKMLVDFVDNKMQEGDLVAIVRVVGGKGLLQQFTSDRQLLRRAIALITPTSHPLMQFNNPDYARFAGIPQAIGAGGDNAMTPSPDAADTGNSDISSATDETNRLFRGLSALSTAQFLIDSLKKSPGHKNVVIVSSGIPRFQSSNSGVAYSNVISIIDQISDNASRAGVV